MAEDPLQRLYRRPGFMIRRAHQIAVAIFTAEMQGLGITKTQYGILYILRHRPGLSQIAVARLLGLDRSTTSMVVKKLEESGLVTSRPEATDLRQRALVLSPQGEDMLKRLAEPVRRAERRVLAAFDPEEQEEFLRLLDKFTGAFNALTRAPVVATEPGREEAPPAGAGRRQKASA